MKGDFLKYLVIKEMPFSTMQSFSYFLLYKSSRIIPIKFFVFIENQLQTTLWKKCQTIEHMKSEVEYFLGSNFINIEWQFNEKQKYIWINQILFEIWADLDAYNYMKILYKKR